MPVRGAKTAAPAAEPVRTCDWPGCERAGEHRAPLAPDRLGEYQHLCLAHVREFNRSWNFFDGWSREAIEAWQHADLSWHRPTWSASAPHPRRSAWAGDGYRDVFGVADDGRAPPHPGCEREAGMTGEERRARSILGLHPGAGEAAIRKRFKEEVKTCHPDVNGGSGKANGRLRDVIWAYRHLTGSPED